MEEMDFEDTVYWIINNSDHPYETRLKYLKELSEKSGTNAKNLLLLLILDAVKSVNFKLETIERGV